MKKTLKLSFLFVILSFFIHLYLAAQHYALKYGYDASQSLCTLNDTFNCEAVTLSPYSYLVGIPMALWGAVFHIVFLILLILAALTPEKPSYFKYSFLFTILSAIASTAMLGVSLTLMSTYCIFCLALYFLSYCNLANYLLSKPKPSLPSGADYKQKSFVILIVAIPLLGFLLNDMSVKSYGNKLDSFLGDSLSQWDNAAATSIEGPLLKMGSSDSQFQVAEFADFQCIHCKNAASKLHAFFLSHPDAAFSFFVFPLDGRCNPGASVRDGTSCVLARAVFCAEKENKGWKAHAWVYDKFGTSEATNFDKMVTDLGLSGNFSTCLESEEAIKAVERQAEIGRASKIDGTPGVFVNGKKLPAGHYIPVLEGLYKKLKSK